MTLTIGNYEVEIKAKDVFADKYNKEDTMGFLLDMSIALAEASELSALRGTYAISERQNILHDDIFNYLDSKGYYDSAK